MQYLKKFVTFQTIPRLVCAPLYAISISAHSLSAHFFSERFMRTKRGIVGIVKKVWNILNYKRELR